MEIFSYKTIERPAEGFYREKGSKFHSFAYPVSSEEQIRKHLEDVHKKYFDARHHCFAWMLGPELRSFRAFDDGEPNHSAGDPILGQIRSRGLTNVLIVVVRYFGGVKLGVGGLVSAYRTAAENALDNATIVVVEITFDLNLRFEYPALPDVMNLVKDHEMQIVRQDFSISCDMDVRGTIRRKPQVLDKINLLNAIGIPIKSTVLY